MPCPVCSETSLPLFTRSSQAGSVHMTSGETRDMPIEGCPRCNFVWNAAAFSDPASFDAWMASAYRSYQLLSNDLHAFPLVDPRSETALAFLDRHLDWSAIGNVLEVGSNRGDFLAFLKSRHPGIQLLGVESSPLAATGIPTVFGDVREVRLSASFDLVVVRQVLEHVANPLDFLVHLVSFLSPEGKLMIEVPDLENDLAEGIDPFVMEHVGHYSEQSLALLAARAGLFVAGVDRSYQLTVILSRIGAAPPSLPAGYARLEAVASFDARVAECQKNWLRLVEEGHELCFYGASNVFLALTGVLRQAWGDGWHGCRKSLIDDYPLKHGAQVGGMQVLSWSEFKPIAPCIYVVCAMYRYHRQKMLPAVMRRLRPQDALYTMWTSRHP